MRSREPFEIAIADPSAIVRSGLATVLRQAPQLNVRTVEIASAQALAEHLRLPGTDLLIVNPLLEGFSLPAFRSKNAAVPCAALVCPGPDSAPLKEFDLTLSLRDDAETIISRVARLLDRPDDERNDKRDGEQDEERDTESDPVPLSQREKEIIVCVVKGMTNKAIADKLFLSVHTVLTHRRNIARKLQIHSPAGLAIYAVIHKLVELQQIKNLL